MERASLIPAFELRAAAYSSRSSRNFVQSSLRNGIELLALDVHRDLGIVWHSMVTMHRPMQSVLLENFFRHNALHIHGSSRVY